MSMLPRLFTKAGATGHVFLIKGGAAIDKGAAYSGFIGPMTTIAVVPGVDQVIQFSLEAKTKDNQSITIAGDITTRFEASKAVAAFDFTVDKANGAFQGNWNAMLQSVVSERTIGNVRIKAKELAVIDAVSAQVIFEECVAAALAPSSPAGKLLADKGVSFVSCSISEIAADDEDVQEAVGVTEREAMLSQADKARHDRQMNAARNAHTIKRFEANTALQLEKERLNLVKQQGANELEKASADAAAAAKRLEPFANVAPEIALVASLMKMGERGVGTLNISPELIGVLQSLKGGR